MLFARCTFAAFLAAFVATAQDAAWFGDDPERVCVTLYNPSGADMPDAPIVIRRERMPVQNLIENAITVIDPEAGAGSAEPIEYQLDDLDKDGVWDELFLMLSFGPNERRTIYIYPNTPTGSVLPLGAYATVASYGHHLVPWWESEFMGWKRWYTDSVDMYAKRGPRFVAHAETMEGINGHESPHELGLDILEVIDTFGAGALCLFEDAGNPDAISRPRFSPYAGQGPIFDTRCSYDLITNGPLRSIVRANTLNWRTEAGTYEVQEDYIAYARQSYSTCSVRFTEFLPASNSLRFGVGMRRVMDESKLVQEDGLVISMTEDMDYTRANVTAPEYKDKKLAFMGIALAVPDKYQPTYRLTEDFGGNHLFSFPVTADLSFEYLMAGAWSEGMVNRSPAEFEAYVRRVVEGINHPVAVSEISVEKNPH